MIDAVGMTSSSTIYYHTDNGAVILSRPYGKIVDETQTGPPRELSLQINFLVEMLNDLEFTNRGISWTEPSPKGLRLVR